MAQTKRKHAGSPASVADMPAASRSAAGLRRAERRWREWIKFDAVLHERRNVRLLTPEARVLLHLRLTGPVTVTAAMEVAGVSYRGFYAVLERLRAAGLVATTRDPQDQRVRRLSIDPSVLAAPTKP